MNTSSVKLTVKGLSNPPSFKNHKRAIMDRKTGRMRTLTEPKVKQWMKQLEDAIVFRLISAYQMAGGATGTGCSLRFWIAMSVPYDDSFLEMPQLSVTVERSLETIITIEIEEII